MNKYCKQSFHGLVFVMSFLLTSSSFAQEETPVKYPTVDVIVVGAGGAGLAASLAAAEMGAKVLLLEKMPSIGGNTLKASGLFNCADPLRQVPFGIKDSPQWHAKQILLSGGGENDRDVVESLTTNALPTLQWLEKHGVVFLPKTISTWGSEWPRGHKPILPRGQAYIRFLSEAAYKAGVKIVTQAQVLKLKYDKRKNAVIGVEGIMGPNKVPFSVLSHHGVVLAAGGFSASKKMLSTWAPEWQNFSTDNNTGNTGDLINAALQVGADVRGMQYVQVVPGSGHNPEFQVRLDLDVSRFIMVDETSERFIDEDTSRNELTKEILKKRTKKVYGIIDQAGLNSYDLISQKDAYRGLQSGDALRAGSIKALAQKIHLNPTVLEKTINDYNKAILTKTAKGKCARVNCKPLQEAPYWASQIILTIHSTMGGLVISPFGEVKRKDGSLIRGLYAAGEITGNVHGANRMGGNGIADAITFGRIAGQQAVKKVTP